MSGENDPIGGDSASAKKFYAVKSGRVPGIYTDWESASEQIKGWQKPKHHSFTTRAEAQKYLDSDMPKTEAPSEEPSVDGNTFFTPNCGDARLDKSVEPPMSKKRKAQPTAKMKPRPSLLEYNENEYEAGYGPLPPGAVDGFDPNIKLDEEGNIVYKSIEERQVTKSASSDIDQTKPIRIHTDGSSLGNGQSGAFAGVGVYFGPGDRR